MRNALVNRKPLCPEDAMIAQIADANKPIYAAIVLFAALAVLTLILSFVDSRTLDGANVWVKPLKFSVSLLVYFATLLFFSRWISASVVDHPLFYLYNGVLCLCALVEIIWIVSAAAGGHASHFNVHHPILAAIYPVMGVVAVALLSATLSYGILILLSAESGLTLFWRHAVGSSLVATFLLTVVTAGYLAASGGHAVGEHIEPSSGLFGWLRSAGDLRVAHFFAMHCMQIVPVAVLLVVSFWPAGRSLMLIYLLVLGYASLVGFTFYQAKAGKPFLPLLPL
jgi:hypothetical protein